jgi:hypothetical protein
MTLLSPSARLAPRAFTCVALLFVGLTSSSTLWAQAAPSSSESDDAAAASQPATEADMEKARAAFNKGRALMESKDWLGAAAQFEAAAQSKNAPGIRYHIAYCLEQAAQKVEALESYEQARKLLEVSPAEDVARLIPAAIERVRRGVGAVVLQDLPPAASITIDEKVYQQSEEILLNPGQHQLVIEKDGYEPFREQVEIAPSGTEIVRVSLVPLAPVETEAATPEPSDAAPKDGVRRAVFWSGLGVAIAGAATGTVGAVNFFSAQSQMNTLTGQIEDKSSNDPDACSGADAPKECDDLAASQKRKQVGTILMVAGGSALVVGGVSALVAEYFWPEAPVTIDVGMTQHTPTFGLRGRF